MFHAASLRYFMRFFKHLFIGESIREPDTVKENLLNSKLQPDIFVISISVSNDQLDIYDSKYLLQPFWEKEKLLIVGIAGSRDEAIRLVISITEKTVRETGTADIKKYLLSVDSTDCEEA